MRPSLRRIQDAVRRRPRGVAAMTALAVGLGLYALTAGIGAPAVERRAAARPLSVRVIAPLLVQTTVPDPDFPESGFVRDVWHLWLFGVPIEIHRGDPRCSGYALF